MIYIYPWYIYIYIYVHMMHMMHIYICTYVLPFMTQVGICPLRDAWPLPFSHETFLRPWASLVLWWRNPLRNGWRCEDQRLFFFGSKLRKCRSIGKFDVWTCGWHFFCFFSTFQKSTIPAVFFFWVMFCFCLKFFGWEFDLRRRQGFKDWS